MKIIGLTGKAGVGKDTVAHCLATQYAFTTYAFAEPIKDMLAAIGVECHNRQQKEAPHPLFGVSPRHMMQTLGTEWMRYTVNAEGWLIIAEERIREAEKNFNTSWAGSLTFRVVISDTRFENEAEWIRAQGGSVWHITRPEVEPVEAHVSENGVRFDARTDLSLVNNGSIEDLRRLTGLAISHCTGPHFGGIPNLFKAIGNVQ